MDWQTKDSVFSESCNRLSADPCLTTKDKFKLKNRYKRHSSIASCILAI